MIYYLFQEKERMELEGLLTREIKEVNDLINTIDCTNSHKDRALQERRDILFRIMKKISNKRLT